jgi:hypothetical protein
MFRYDGTYIVRVEGNPTGAVYEFHDMPDGLLLVTEKGLFRYNGTYIEPAADLSLVNRFYNTRYGLLLLDAMRETALPVINDHAVKQFNMSPMITVENGLFSYDYHGTRTVHVAGDQTGKIDEFHEIWNGVLLRAQNGLFRYDGTRITRVEGERTGEIYEFHDIPDGVLLRA